MPTDPKDSPQLAAFRRSAEAYLGPPDQSYADLREKAFQLLWTVREEIACRIEPSFNEALNGMPQGNYEEKKRLGSWVNGEIASLGLGIQSKSDDHASRVYAYPQGKGRFHFRYRDDSGIRHTHGSPSKLDDVSLTPIDLHVYATRRSKGQS